MTTIEQMRALRTKLPRGKKDPWGECCKSKRILLQRALRRKTLTSMTAGEYAVVQEWLVYIQDEQTAASKELKSRIDKITQL